MTIILQKNRFYPPHLTVSSILLRSGSSRGLQPRRRNFTSADISNCKTRYRSLTVTNEGGEINNG